MRCAWPQPKRRSRRSKLICIKPAVSGRDADLLTQAARESRHITGSGSKTRPTDRAGADVARKLDAIERRLNIVALCAERNEIYRIARSGKLTDESTRRLVRELDLLEARYSIH